MAFTEAERVSIRRWLGYPAVYKTSFTQLEDAITQSQSTSDGGVRPDTSTEIAVRGYLMQLTAIETQWLALLDQMQAYKLSDLTVDPLRAQAGLFKMGRTYVGFVADAFDTKPIRDVFSAPTIGNDSNFRSGVG